jgi:hypothetical protein
MLASSVNGQCFQPHSPGRKSYLSRAKRVTPAYPSVVFDEKSRQYSDKLLERRTFGWRAV